MRRSSLAKRLDLVEFRERPRLLPRLAFVIHEDDAPSSVQGFRVASGEIVRCEPFEALSGAMERAFRHPGARGALFAVYAISSEPTLIVAPAFVAAPVKLDPSALAGIGIVGRGWKTIPD